MTEPTPTVLCNTDAVGQDPRAAGAVFKLEMAERDLDANVIQLPAGDGIGEHVGPDLDVLLHVLAGNGTLTTDDGEISLTAGDLVWLPRRSRRRFSAGDGGLRYLTVHQRRHPRSLDPTVPPAR
jgi:quercetin dioxygenase-like cupin family protein